MNAMFFDWRKWVKIEIQASWLNLYFAPKEQNLNMLWKLFIIS